ncbi:hypothetical protein K2173_005864 [Erythroxylum novogranatense]|uniref:Uncharacterized protein n=1 Tax=Erythroxylum novogranatense TaxID=1862640 RepID=A0AAV8U5M8_9ROSI|nr:hypothetical protein K2173_005864 [Erythroxylum novogranatense]
MEFQDVVLIAATSLGFISLLKLVHAFFNWIWVVFLRPPKNLKKYGSWVLITGSTDGIGKALALELAAKGLNLVIVGRNPAKIEVTVKEIRERVGEKVDIKNIVIDLAKSAGEEICKIIEEGIRGLDVGILINNAGVAYPYALYFHELDSELMQGIMKVNAESATWVVRAVLPGMLKRKKGAIVNIGSGSSVVLPSYPLYTIYGATKAYLAMFSKCLNVEYKHLGIDVQCQIPLLVSTKMSKMKKSTFLVPSPETYAKASIRWIGYEHLCSPVWSHTVQWLILSALPDSLLNWCVFRYFNGMRERGLKRDNSRKRRM